MLYIDYKGCKQMRLYDDELEKNVLATLILDFNKDIMAKLTEDDFTRQNKDIFTALQVLDNKNEEIDIITVTAYLNDRGNNYKEYICKMIDESETVDMENAVKILKEKTKTRNIALAGEKLIKIARDNEDINMKISKVTEILDAIEKQNDIKEIKKINEIAVDVMRVLDERVKQEGKSVGISTGFVDLDKVTGGLRAGELVVIAARPAMGKSAFALDIAMNVSLQGYTTLMFSLEMSPEEIGERMFIQSSLVDGYQIRSGRIRSETWDKINNALYKASTMPLYVDGNADTKVNEMRAVCRQFKRNHDLKLVVVDYLQLMEGENGANRQEEIAKISRNLKKLARNLDVPVIVISQLNRSVEQRMNKRPMLADLRESGAIEQDADMVWFIYRDEYYNPKTEDKNIAEINIAKQRMGPTGVIQLAFWKDYITFRNLVQRNV
jgi:replicative DNA helicase